MKVLTSGKKKTDTNGTFSKYICEALFTRTLLIELADGIIQNCYLNIKKNGSEDTQYFFSFLPPLPPECLIITMCFMFMHLKTSRKHLPAVGLAMI